MYPPDDPTRPCRPKAGQGLVMMMMMMMLMMMMMMMAMMMTKKVGVLVLQAGWLPKGKIGGVPASDTPREMNR